MAALATDTIRATHGRQYVERTQVVNAGVIYAGSLVGLNRTDGYARVWSDLSGQTMVFLGVALRGVTGNTSASPVPGVEIDVSGVVIEQVPVGGPAGDRTQAQVGDLVYATTDNDFTLNSTGAVNAVGILNRWYSGTTCDVKLFTPMEYRAFIGT